MRPIHRDGNSLIGLQRWSRLFTRILDLKSLAVPTLPIQDPALRERCLAYNTLIIDRLIALLLSSQHEAVIEKKLREIITLCSNYTVLTSVDFFLNIHLPANLALRAAQAYIAKPDEVACQALRPTLKKILCSGFGETDIKLASQGDEEFSPVNFVPDGHDETLIAVSECYDYAADNTRLLFSILDITDDGRQWLRQVAGQASIDYFDMLEKKHYQDCNVNPFSFGFILNKLMTALFQSSVDQNGSEFDVDFAICKNPILCCYNEWRKLSIEVKEKIKNYQIKNSKWSGTLEEYLLVLFAGIAELPVMRDDEKIVLTDDEYTKIKLATVRPEGSANERDDDRAVVRIPLNCTKQFAEQISGIIDAHSDLAQIPLAGKEDLFQEAQNAEPINPEKLAELAVYFKSALKNRPPLKGIRDHQLVDRQLFFELIVDYHCLGLRLTTILARLEEKKLLSTAENIGVLLLFLPLDSWGFVFQYKKTSIMSVFSTDVGPVQSTCVLLNIIPSA